MFLKSLLLKVLNNVLSVNPRAALAIKAWLAGTAELCFLSLEAQPVRPPCFRRRCSGTSFVQGLFCRLKVQTALIRPAPSLTGTE